MPFTQKDSEAHSGLELRFGLREKKSVEKNKKKMDVKTKISDISLEKLGMVAEELMLPGRFILRVLNAALESVTNVLAAILGSQVVRRHFHLMLSGLVLFGPVLSLWVSKFSIFTNSHHYLYR